MADSTLDITIWHEADSKLDVEWKHLNDVLAWRKAPVLMSIPKCLPRSSDRECLLRRRDSTSVASKPALSHSWRGMTSSAFAYALTNTCDLPGMERAYSLQHGHKVIFVSSKRRGSRKVTCTGCKRQFLHTVAAGACQ